MGKVKEKVKGNNKKQEEEEKWKWKKGERITRKNRQQKQFKIKI